MRDRFTRGFIAGIIAGIPAFIFNMGSYYLNFMSIRWMDFMTILTIGRRTVGPAETIFAIAATFIFVSILGALFALIIPLIKSKNYLLKGWAFGAVIWFGAFSITHLYQIPGLIYFSLQTVISNFIGASIWGLSLGMANNWLEHRLKI